jgi:hypothetical protein
MAMKKGLIYGAIVLLILVGVVWFLSRGSFISGGNTKLPAGVIFIPKQAPAMVSSSVSWRVWQQQPQIWSAFQALLRRQGLDFQADIKPWLGDEITLAVTTLDYDHNPSNGIRPGYLLVTTTTDAAQTKEFFQTWRSRQLLNEAQLTYSTYQGAEIIAPVDDSLASTLVADQFVLIANHPQVIREALSNAQAIGLNLGNSPSYQQVAQSLKQSRLVFGFVNLPALGAWLGNRADYPITEAPPALGISLTVAEQKIIAQTALTPPRQAAAADSQILRYIPPSSGLFLTGHGGLDLAAINARLLQQIEAQWQIKLSPDLLGWVSGDYALAWLPDGEQGNWVFVAEAAQDLTKVNQALQDQGISVAPVNILGQPAEVWSQIAPQFDPRKSQLSPIVRGVHSRLGKYEVFTTSVPVMAELITDDRAAEPWLGLAKEFDRPNQGYLYIQWPEGRRVVIGQLPILQLLELPLRSLFQRTESLAFTTYPSQSDVQLGELQLSLGKN